MPATDKMIEYGVLAFTPGAGEQERYIGHIGKLDNWEKTETPKAGIRLTMGKPADGSPYAALSFKIPRQKNLKWTFGDSIEEPQRYHQAHLQFHSNSFEMRFKTLTPAETALASHSFPVPQGSMILAIRFTMMENCSPMSIGFKWPTFPAAGDGQFFTDQLQSICKAVSWTLYVADNDDYIKKFKNIDRTFAECGRGSNTDHYRKNGRVE